MNIGNIVQHVKRGTTYRIFGIFRCDVPLMDDMSVYVHCVSMISGDYFVANHYESYFGDDTIKAKAQVSTNGSTAVGTQVVLYKTVLDLHENAYWLRPLDEFTPDRFVVVA